MFVEVPGAYSMFGQKQTNVGIPELGFTRRELGLRGHIGKRKLTKIHFDLPVRIGAPKSTNSVAAKVWKLPNCGSNPNDPGSIPRPKAMPWLELLLLDD